MRYLNAGKFSSIHKVDRTLLERELAVRRLLCEVPNCDDLAVSFLSDAMPSLICAKHRDVMTKGMAYSLKTAMVDHMKRLVFEAANRAYANSEDEQVFNYDPSAAIERYLSAPVVSAPEHIQMPVVLARPAIATLKDYNVEPLPLMDLFPSF